jgi:hypothetical protein
MTYIHPENHKSILNFIIAGLIFTSFVGAFWLVALYNNTVNLNHNIAAAKSELDSVGAKNTTLNNQVVAALGNVQSGDLATADGLVQDNHPQYFPTNQSWPIASQQ